MTRRLLDVGESAVLVECPDLADVLALKAGLDADPITSVGELVPGARTLLVRLQGAITAGQRDELLTRTSPPRTEQAGEPVRIEVTYDGDDLAEVAGLTGLTTEEVVEAHTGQQWTVGFCGFAPGFAYLHGTDDRLRVPRRATPRKRVPLGAVGLADVWSGIYPRVGPGGWQLIGQTDQTLWDLSQTPPALLQPGMVVQFVAR